MEVITDELIEIKEQFGDERKTEIIASCLDLSDMDLITEEDMVVTISHGGYAKSQQLDVYQAQRRGGKGKAATKVKDEDYVEHLLIASTHDTILCFTSLGKVYWLKVFEIPSAGRNAKGRPIVNLLPLSEGERITAILPIREYEEGKFIFMATQNGTVKKTALTSFARQRSSGLIALTLEEGDHLVGVAVTDGSKDIMLFADNGKAVRFNEQDVREMGRTARGVRGIRLTDDEKLLSLIIPAEDGTVLTASENGYGKRTDIADYPAKGRGGKGVICMVQNDRNGKLVGATQIFEGDEIMMISDQGTLVRTRGNEVSVQGRNTQGVRLIRLSEGEQLIGLERVAEPEEIELAEGEIAQGEIVEGEVVSTEESSEATNAQAPEADDSAADETDGSDGEVNE